MSEVDGIPTSRTLPLSNSHSGRRGSEAKGKPKTQLLALQKEVVDLDSQDPRRCQIPTHWGLELGENHRVGEKSQCGSWAGF